MKLLIGFYLDPDPARCGEFIECIRRNAANGSIDRIDVFVEVAADPAQLRAAYPILASPNVRLIPHERRVTYADLFAHANRQPGGERVAIANADIYFDRTLARLDDYDLRGKLLCLSRRDLDENGTARLFEHPFSQDAWIFETPIREFPCGFHLGLPGCDNRLAWEARRAGLAVSNPSRSVAAVHLHLTPVRRYSEANRLSGAGIPVPATFLNTPWLWFAVRYMGQPADFKVTIDAIAGQPRSEYVLLDDACPEGATAWVKEHCHGRRGLGSVDNDGIVCFLDPGVVPAADFSSRILAEFQPGSFLIPDGEEPESASALVVSKAEFDQGGLAGLIERRFPACLLTYRNGAPRKPPLAANGVGCARVAFHETMGYSIARLREGVSSHNNDPRPFARVPETLAGHEFTQVVACRVSPIEVEFLSAGKLYVLVGTDWDGARVAKDWLMKWAVREPMKPVETRSGTGFEVWSLTAAAGDRFVLPTQVMLVADRLERT